jgi:hypothetical protein
MRADLAALSRGEEAALWIEKWCCAGSRPVQLTRTERAQLREIYDDRRQSTPVSGALANYVTLLHLCGVEALQREFRPAIGAVNVFTLWSAAGPGLRQVLRPTGDGGLWVPEINTYWPFQPLPPPAGGDRRIPAAA